MLSSAQLMADPFLGAHAFSSDFSDDPDLTEDSTVAHLQFGGSMIKHIRLPFVRENGHLLISSIEKLVR